MPQANDIQALLRDIIDPDVGVNIVDLGLVEAIEFDGDTVRVGLIMTTPACPQTGHLKAEAARILAKAGFVPDVAVLDQPLWSPERMSDLARKALGWGS